MTLPNPRMAHTYSGPKGWGLFAPLYALRSPSHWGIGDFSDWEHFLEWTAALGGRLAGALPLLPVFDDGPWAPSPYAPVSRLFWNEVYLDVTAVPEFPNSPAARGLSASPAFQEELKRLRSSPLVDYPRVTALKRRVLDLLLQDLRGRRLEDFVRFLRENPAVTDYARFRAVCERLRTSWRVWPEPLRSGRLEEDPRDESAVRYHQYVQWLLDEAFARLRRKADDLGLLLYLDLPLGVHPDGYDAWRFRPLFAEGMAVGAPPDPFFAGGQNWGFAPLDPSRILDDGAAYWRACLRHHLKKAGILRLDHVMGLHRLFWIPEGRPVAEGSYVRYPAEELYDVLCEESRAHGCVIAGEDLGTVPPEVRETMKRRGILRTVVLSFEGTITEPDAVASLNTHDLPPFAAVWGDSETSRQTLWRHLEALAKSPAALAMIALEDLWLETEPQNRPGTTNEFPNWRRKMRLSVEEFREDPFVLEALRKVGAWRRGL